MMPREPDISINEQTFIRQALREGVRLDGRPLDSYRDLSIEFGEEYGSVDVRLGKTRVLTALTTQITRPLPERKFDGIFTISLELSPQTAPNYDSSTTSRSSLTESLLSRLLEKTIRRSFALDTESLCLIPGEKCFALRADAHVLCHDGNVLDAACVALITALLHFRRPDVTVQVGEVKVWNVNEREPVPLNVLHVPFCVSWSYFDGGEVVIVDASAKEEAVREGEVVVGVNRFGEVCHVSKFGGAAVDPILLLAWTKKAVEKAKWLDSVVREVLGQDAAKRNPRGVLDELRAENER